MDLETKPETNTSGPSNSEESKDDLHADAPEMDRPVAAPPPETHHEAPATVVEVNSIGRQGVQIHVVCTKRLGLLENLVSTVEGAGLLLLEAEISAHDHITFDAVGIQEGQEVDAAVLKRLLLDLINDAYPPSVTANSSTESRDQ